MKRLATTPPVHSQRNRRDLNASIAPTAAETAAAIFPKLKSGDNTVRITAQQAWVAMTKQSDG